MGTLKGWWIPQLPDRRDWQFIPPGDTPLPPVVDLRGPHMPPVYDQGPLGSCVANVVAGAMEYQGDRQGRHGTPSRMFLWYNARAMEGTEASNVGCTIRDAIKSVNTQGDCPEWLWPYNPDAFATDPPGRCYRLALHDRALKYEAVAQDPELVALKSALSLRLPVALGIVVYTNFGSDNEPTTGVIPMPGPDDTPVGGHALLAVGYDDSREAVLVRNSWSVMWGDQGYGWLPYAYAADPNLSSDWWAIQMVTPPGR